MITQKKWWSVPSLFSWIIFVLFFLIFIFDSRTTANAGEYKLLSGKSLDVCKVYQENLNSIGADMTCNRQVDPASAEIGIPKWERWNIAEHQELLKRAKKYLETGDQFSKVTDYDNPEAFNEYLKQSIKSGYDVLDFSELDINNDGHPEKILRISDGICMVTHRFGTALLVLNNDETSIDVDKTRSLSQNKFRASNGIGRWDYNLYGVFLYKKNVYFDK